MKKRILSMALVFSMILTLMPIVAKAVTNLDVSTGNVIISTPGDYIITGSTSTNTIKVNPNVTGVNIILSNVTVDVNAIDDACAFDIGDGASVNVTLTDGTTNTFKSGSTKAGVKVEAPTSGTAGSVVIGGTGTLIAVGGKSGGTVQYAGSAAGIGSNGRKDPYELESVVPASGNITINSGTIQATGGEGAFYAGSGIGGGASSSSEWPYGSNGGNTTIHGGNVKATGGSAPNYFSGAGIGGGSGARSGIAGTLLIDGGVVDAKSGNGQWVGNGIGSGFANTGERKGTASIKIQGTAVVNAVTPDAINAYGPIGVYDRADITIGGTASVQVITGKRTGGFRCNGAISARILSIIDTPKITVLSVNNSSDQKSGSIVPIYAMALTSTVPIISGIFEAPLSTTSSTDIRITGGNLLNTQTISLPANYSSFATTVGSRGNYYGTIGTDSLQEISSLNYNFNLTNKINNYNVKSASLRSIAVKTPATKLMYLAGDTLDISGLVIEGTYSDNTKKDEIITTANVTGFDSSVRGVQTLTVNVGGKRTTYDVQIKANQSELSIIDIPETVTYGDNSFTLSTTGGNGTGAINYSSDNTNVLTVDDNGNVTVVGAGDAIITATKAAEGNYNSINTTKKITVNKADQSVIEITDVPSKVTYGDSKFTLKTTGGLGTGRVIYSSDNTNALTVDENTGAVTVVGIGNATITATKAVDSNYNSVIATAEITVNKKDINIINTDVKDKNYDGTIIAEFSGTPELDGVISGDAIDLIKGTPSFANKNVGSNIDVDFTNFSIDGAYVGNYNLIQPNSVTANITSKDITVKNTSVNNKTYDGSTSAKFSITPVLDGVINGETVTLISGTPSFANKNVGSDIGVNFTTFSIDGTDVGNYNLKQPSSVTANITSKDITVKNTGVNNKTYDGSTSAKFSTTPVLDGVISGETVTLTNGTPSFKSKNVGSDIDVDFTTFSIVGTDVGNYKLIQPSSAVANITTKDITVITVVKDKAYDGTIFAEFLGAPQLNGVINGDTVTLTNGIPSFNSKNVGISIGIGFTIFSIDGVDAANYSLIQPNSIFAKINKANQSTLEMKDVPSKVTYGDNSFNLSTVGGSGTGDTIYSSSDTSVLTVNATTGDVTVVGIGNATITVTKAGDSNYNSANATTEITVNKKDINIINTDVKGKIYSGTTIAEFAGAPGLSGVINGDAVTLTNGTASFANKNVGSDIEVNFTTFSIDGTDARNYNLKQPSSVKANINKATLTVSTSNVSIISGESLPQFNVIISGFVNGENETNLTGLVIPEVMIEAKDTTKVGVYPLTFSTGNPTNNYSFSPLSGSSLTIIEKINAQIPRFDKATETVTYVQGATASALKCSATVTDGGNVSYQWYESDGTPISKATDNTYTPSTDKTGVFYYYLVATNTNNGVNGDKIATAKSNTYKVVVNKVEILPADKKDDTPTVTIKDDDIGDKVLSDADKLSLANGSDISIKFNVAMVEAPVDKGDESSVTSALKGQNFGIYLDISLIKTIIDAKGKVTNDKIQETKGVIRLVIDIPEKLRSTNRTFSIIRVHNGVAETLVDLDNDPNTITIETDRFSTYALAYKDEVTNTSTTTNGSTTTTTTKTSDNTPVIPLTLFAIVSLFVGVNTFKKGKYKEAIKK